MAQWIEAAWAALCPPVRERYLAEGEQPGPEQPAGRAAGTSAGPPAGARPLAGGAAPGGPLPPAPAGARRGPLPPTPASWPSSRTTWGACSSPPPPCACSRPALPECELTVMAGPWAADVAAHCPVVDRVEVCPFPGFAPARRRRARERRGVVVLGRGACCWSRRPGSPGKGSTWPSICHPGFYWGAALAAVGRGAAPGGLRTPRTRPPSSPTRCPSRRARWAPPPAPAPGRTWPTLGLALAREALSIAGQQRPADCRPAPPLRAVPRRAGRGGAPLAGPQSGPGAGGDRHPSRPGGAGQALDGAALRHRRRPLRRALRGPHRAHGGPGGRGGGPRRRPRTATPRRCSWRGRPPSGPSAPCSSAAASWWGRTTGPCTWRRRGACPRCACSAPSIPPPGGAGPARPAL